MRETICCFLRLVLKKKEMKAKDFGAPPELWNENVAICKRCGKPVCFAKNENGKWVVLEPDFHSFHKCSHIKEVFNDKH